MSDDYSVKFVKRGDPDYPLSMYGVPNGEKYDIVTIKGVALVPLFQVIDLLINSGVIESDTKGGDN